MKVVFPMTGPIHFPSDTFTYPKPLIDINGRTMLENAVAPFLQVPNIEVVAVMNSEDVTNYNLDQVFKRASDKCRSQVRTVKEATAGALCTTLLVSDLFEDEELIISNYDHLLNFNVTEAIEYFRSENADFGVISFNSVHPKWSFVRLDDNGIIIEAAEKNPISSDALVGLYYFKSAVKFVDGAKNTILSAPSDKERFYTSEVINSLILEDMKGCCYRVAKEQYYNFYDAAQVSDFVKFSRQSGAEKSEIRRQTKAYIRAFNNKNVSELENIFCDDAVLYDPNVGEVVSKASILEFVAEIFEKFKELSFIEKIIMVDEERSLIEFTLTLDGSIIKGVDLILWESGKIKRIDAYLETV